MIQARYFYRSGHHFTFNSVALASSPRAGPKFYSAFAGATSRYEFVKNPLTRPLKPWSLCQWRSRRLNCASPLRFASTSPTPIAEVHPNHVPASQTSAPMGEEILPTSLDELTSSIPPPVYEHLGFLKEMGLDYGWGPTAFVETLLEHVYIYLGTPWWASIAISMLIIRAALLKFYIDAADTSARRQLIKPLEAPIRQRIDAARSAKDMRALMKASQEMSALNRSAGIKVWKAFVPFVQLPLGYGTFRLLRGMAYLPVPGFDTGGLLWLNDMTQSDPYFVLPIATAATYYFTFKSGGELGTSGLVSPTAQIVFLYVVPPLSGLFMLFWPGGLQLTFFISALIAGIQARCFRNAWFRNLVGIQPLPEPAVPEPQTQTRPRYQAPSSTASDPEAPKGTFGKVKGAVSELMKAGKKFSGMSRQRDQKERLTAGEKRHAKAYDEKRNREIAREAEMKRQLAQEEFEKQQEQGTREQETREQHMREQEKQEKFQRRVAKKARQRQ